MIFDSHFHLLPEEVYKSASFYNEGWGDIHASIKAMDEAGVDRALISYPTTDYHIRKGVTEIQAARAYNGAAAEIAAQSSGRFKYLAMAPLTEPGEMHSEMMRAVDEGASGLSMPANGGGIYPDDEKFLPFFEEAQKRGLPVFFHPTTLTPFGHKELRHPLITPVFQYAFDTSICLAKIIESGLLKKLPRLKLVFASFGGVMPFLAGRFDRTYRMLLSRGIVGDMGEDPGETLKRIYVDTSGATSPALIALAVEVFGEGRVLWGSDYPANKDIKSSIAAIKNEKILGQNLKGILQA